MLRALLSLLLSALLLWQPAAHAVDLNQVPSGTSLNSLWQVAFTPRSWSLDDVRGAQGHEIHWSVPPAHTLWIPGGQSLWLQLQVEPNGALAPPRWVAEIARPGIDRVEMFRVEGDYLTLNEVAGDDLSVAVWPLSGRHPAFDIVSTRWTPVVYYLRITHEGPLSLAGSLRTAADFTRSQLLSNLFFGGFIGAMGLLLVLAVSAAASTRRLPYAAFAVYATGTAFSCISASGLLGEWWVEGAPHVLDAMPHVSAIVTAALGLFYMSTAAALRELSKPRYMATMAIVAAGLLLAAGSPWLAQPASAQPWITVPYFALALAYGSFALLVALALLGYAYLKGELWIRSHALSLLVFGMALSYPLAEALLQVRMPPAVFYIIAVTAVFHLALSYGALNGKMKKLMEAKARLQASSTVDPLTGVANYRRLTLQMPGLLERARYNQHHGALLMVEIANLGDFSRADGQRGMEFALVRAAAAIRSCIKNIDLVSRVGDATFAVAVEGPVTDSQASSVATHIIATGLRTPTAYAHDTPLSLRVYIELVPKRGHELEQLLADAARELRAVPVSDPRKIFVGNRGGEPAG